MEDSILDEEVYVSIETAKLADSKGFGIIGRSVFHKDFSETGYREEVYQKNIGYNYKLHNEILRPTQTCLQKWLREKHNISVLVEHGNMELGFFGYFTRVYSDISKGSNQFKVFKYETEYEKALEHGLIEGLQLIK
jgi:hypothetical protein